MRKFLVFASATTLLAGSAEAMDLATFLRHADSVERMGARAMFSSEARLLMDELNASNTALRAERLAAQAAGRRPAYCPERHSRAGPQEVVAALRTIAPARRSRIQLRDALRAFYSRRYPCAS